MVGQPIDLPIHHPRHPSSPSFITIIHHHHPSPSSTIHDTHHPLCPLSANWCPPGPSHSRTLAFQLPVARDHPTKRPATKSFFSHIPPCPFTFRSALNSIDSHASIPIFYHRKPCTLPATPQPASTFPLQILTSSRHPALDMDPNKTMTLAHRTGHGNGDPKQVSL